MSELRDIIEDIIKENSRWRIVRARIRKGKIQRRKKVSSVKGFTFRKRGGQVRFIRISTAEKMHRRLGARRAKIKRKGKRTQIRLHLRRSLRKRHSLGL